MDKDIPWNQKDQKVDALLALLQNLRIYTTLGRSLQRPRFPGHPT
jgi:hypothetical protein